MGRRATETRRQGGVTPALALILLAIGWVLCANPDVATAGGQSSTYKSQPTYKPQWYPPPATAKTPLRITLVEPRDTAAQTESIRVTVAIESAVALRAARVRRLGSAYEVWLTPDQRAPGYYWADVKLVDGPNVLRVEAKNTADATGELTFTVTRESLVTYRPTPPDRLAELRRHDAGYPAPAPPAQPLPPTDATAPTTGGAVSTAVRPSVDTEPPRITINYPSLDTAVQRDQLVVLGLVTDDTAVDRVQITVNGVEAPQTRDIAVAGRSLTIRTPVVLQMGENVIEIAAADRAGNVAQLVRTVRRLPETAAPPPVVRTGSRWAVVIGISQYENRGIPALRFAERDAQAVYRFLTTRGGFPAEQVLLLTDRTEQKPTLENIRRALGDFLARRPGRDDTVLIYFAGHGAPEIDAVGAESDGLVKYLVPRNADPDSLYSTAFPMDEVQRIFARIPAERVIMFLDTCYSGYAGGRTFARQQVRAGGVTEQFLDRLTRSKGRVIITASGPNEVALELPEVGHGLFTHYLLEGLDGRADRNRDGIVTVSELYEYLEETVDRRARALGGRQRPVMKGEIEGTLPLSQSSR
jgi:hypothetical protein